uniref:GHMP kinase C-terminal domain-containing protein n=1 Tax=Aegilops tauschii TaxID=37682 RepID=R7W9N1_AEGTA
MVKSLGCSLATRMDRSASTLRHAWFDIDPPLGWHQQYRSMVYLKDVMETEGWDNRTDCVDTMVLFTGMEVWSWSRQQASRSSQGSSPSHPLHPTPQNFPYRIPTAATHPIPAMAVDALFGSLPPRDGLVLAGLESEKAVSGFHADNISPAILGGFVLVRSYEPFRLVQLPCPPALRLCFVLVTPEFEAPTSKMRAALPKNVALSHHTRNSSQAAALVAAVLQGDAALIGSAMSSDFIVEPTRAPLIPGMAAVKAAALEAGALGCTISGAGPTAVAVIEGEEKGEEVARRMVDAFLSVGKLKATATIAQLDRDGARVISTSRLE